VKVAVKVALTPYGPSIFTVTVEFVQIDFNSSERSSVGVEWELELVDLATRELASGSNEILAEVPAAADPDQPKAKHELFQSCIEVNTSVCSTVAEAREDLADTIKQVTHAAVRLGLGVMCSGSHPFTHWQTQVFTENPRYAMLVERNQWLARQLQIFGVHVHVGVRSADKIMPIVNALLQYIGHFLALSASSPYWIGQDTGLASYRSKIFEALPTGGLPDRLASWPDFERYVGGLLSSRTIQSTREVWWDVRPHPRYGTVEVRICDGLPTLEEVCAVAALTQCLVELFDAQLDRGYRLPSPSPWVVRENKWRAARYGLDATILVDEAGTMRPVRMAVLDLVDELMPIAHRLQCDEELAIVPRILQVGASYQRQRSVAAANGGELSTVVDSLLDEMRRGLVT
jgi:glutamate---cysteine ligase / carboxylate-amine ligase